MSYYVRHAYQPRKLADQTLNGQPWHAESLQTEQNRTNDVHVNVDDVQEVLLMPNTKTGTNFVAVIKHKWMSVLVGFIITCGLIAVVLGPMIKAIVDSTTGSTSLTTLTTLTTTSVTTVTTVTTTTTTAAPASFCISTSSGSWSNNTLLYSNTRNYAFGLLNNQLGVYRVNSTNNATSSAVWTATQSSTASCWFALQTDRNLVVYGTSGGVFWAANVNNGGVGRPFCLQMWDSGNVQWIDNSSTVVWQTNSAQTG